MFSRRSLTLAVIATFSLAANAMAGTILLSSPARSVKTPFEDLGHTGTPGIVEIVVNVDVTGMMSCDSEGDVDNDRMTVNLFDLLGGPAPNPNEVILLTGIGWNLDQRAGLDSAGASWLSEMTFGFDYEEDGTNDLFLTPSGTDSSGTETNSSGGIVNLLDISLPNGLLPNGIMTVELFESFDDEADVCEGIIDAGTLSFDVIRVPEPTASPLFALAGLVMLGSRRQR